MRYKMEKILRKSKDLFEYPSMAGGSSWLICNGCYIYSSLMSLVLYFDACSLKSVSSCDRRLADVEKNNNMLKILRSHKQHSRAVMYSLRMRSGLGFKKSTWVSCKESFS